MADIIITPGSSLMSFTSSLNYTQTLAQDASGSLTLQGSGSTGRTDLFTVNGNNGTLFSVSDDLSNSLFSVNTIAGLPVIEAFANNTVVMGQYGQNVLVVTGSNVGIGTSNPSNKLHIRQTGIADNTATTLLLIDGQFQDSSVEDTDIVSIGFRIENSNGGSQTSQAISFAYNNILSLMKDGGNVGINTTTPGYPLSVNGSIYAGGAIRIGGTNPFYFEDYGGGWFMQDSAWIRSYNAKSIWIDNGLIGGDGGLTIGYGGAAPPSSGAIIAGNVGIGTSSPGAKVEINAASSSPILRVAGGGDGSGGGKGNIRSSDQGGSNFWDLGRDNLSTGNFMITPSSGTPSLSITIGGNVGIGTTSPGTVLHVVGGIGATGGSGFNTFGVGTWIGGDGTNGLLYMRNGNSWAPGYLDASSLYLNSQSGGNVGIGTSSPAEKLDVNGKTKTTTLQVTNGATNGYVLTSDASGNGTWQAAAGGGGVHILLKPQSNKKYGLGVTGEYSFTSGNTTANQIILAPFIPANSITIRSLEVNVTAVNAGGLCRILVYRDANGIPYNKIIESSDLSSASTGTKTYLVNYTFNAGTTYWIGIHANDSINLNIHNASQVMQIDYFLSVWPYISKTSTSYTFGSAPSTLDIQESAIANPFVVLLTSN